MCRAIERRIGSIRSRGAAAAITSASSTRPCLPVPGIAATSTPAAVAVARAAPVARSASSRSRLTVDGGEALLIHEVVGLDPNHGGADGHRLVDVEQQGKDGP